MLYNSAVTPKAIFWFGHAETIIPFVTLLGLFNHSEHLRSDNYNEQVHNRAFRAAYIAPFAANIAFHLHHCPQTGQYIIQPRLNEQSVLWPLCRDVACPIEEIYKYLEDCLPHKFNFNSYCAQEKDEL